MSPVKSRSILYAVKAG